MLQENCYDVVLLDLHLPDGEGISLIKRIKQQVPETPVVVLTGVKDDTLAVEALREGAQDYVLKSDTFSPTRLLQLGHTDLGNWLVRRIQYAVKRAELARQLNRQPKIDSTHRALASQCKSVWDWNIESDSLYFSSYWRSALGIEKLSEEGSMKDGFKQWLLLIHPEDQARFSRVLRDYLSGQQQQFYCEYRIRQTDGEYIWVMIKGEALWNSQGVAYRMAGSQIDISDRREEEAAAHKKRELISTTLHAVGAGLLSIQANLFTQEGDYEAAEPLLESALALRRSLLGPVHPDVGANLYNLAALYDNQFRFVEAESLFKEALAVFEETLGPDSLQTQRVRTKVKMICRLNQAIKLANAERTVKGC